MKTEWDYSALADAYLKRPDYSATAIDAMLSIAGVKKGDSLCDIGAGVAHLTLMLAARGFNLAAVEPNDAMRKNGIKRTEKALNVRWYEGTGEATGQATHAFHMATFGSSFNVCDRQQTLIEISRILKPHGWFACMWNHRQLDDPIQCRLESIIKERISGYGYGTRREDQTEVIDASGLFGPVVHIASRIIHQQSISECVQAWRSHATLERQSGTKFDEIVAAIESTLKDFGKPYVQVPYTTNIWMAQLR